MERACVSAWGLPEGAVVAKAMISSAWAMMQPTGGLGKVEPWAEDARDRAARIIFVSRARWAA